MKPVDTDALIKEIKEEIEQGTYNQELPEFKKRRPSRMQIHPERYTEWVIDEDALKGTKNVTLVYGLPGGVKGFVLKVFRKIVTPIIHPAFYQQNRFNENVAYSFELLDGEIQDLKKIIEKQQKEIEELKKKL